MRILCFGSLNIDHVYGVDHIVSPGETLASRSYEVFAGGKGANQSAALALAGADASHAGRVGTDGGWLRDGLAELGVDVSSIVIDPSQATGHAVIQVEETSGENAIFLYPGCNHGITADQVSAALSILGEGDILLLQNEINNTPLILKDASQRGITVCLNPAPFGPEVTGYPLELVDLLVVNQTEAAGLAATQTPSEDGDDHGDDHVDAMVDRLRGRFPTAEILLTLGADGAILDGPRGRHRCAAHTAGPVVDTTAAGDTFIGFFLAARAAGADDDTCLKRAAIAAGLCVTRAGARDSIPRHQEVESTLGE